MIINIIIQARSSSKRFRGKILKILNRKRLIFNVIDNLKKINKINKIIVATTYNSLDNLLCYKLKKNKVLFKRGSEDNVYKRFRQCCIENKCDYFIRISADSPFINPNLIQKMIDFLLKNHKKKIDIITSNFPKKISPGQSVEIISSKVFLKYEKEIITSSDKEHVFPKFYKNIKKFNSYTIKLKDKLTEDYNSCIDYPADILKKKKYISNNILKKKFADIIIKKTK